MPAESVSHRRGLHAPDRAASATCCGDAAAPAGARRRAGARTTWCTAMLWLVLAAGAGSARAR